MLKWKSLFYHHKTKFPNPYDQRSLYQTLDATNKKVIFCIIASPQNEAESECPQYFKKYNRSLDTVMLKHLLCFLIGAEILVVEAINVTFKKNESKFTRRPIAHICGPCLELPSTYSNFCELREDILNILKKSTWEVDLV